MNPPVMEFHSDAPPPCRGEPPRLLLRFGAGSGIQPRHEHECPGRI